MLRDMWDTGGREGSLQLLGTHTKQEFKCATREEGIEVASARLVVSLTSKKVLMSEACIFFAFLCHRHDDDTCPLHRPSPVQGNSAYMQAKGLTGKKLQN